MKRFLVVMAMIMAVFACACHGGHHVCAAEKPFKVLASIFPVYLFTANVCADAKNVQVELLIPAAAGCPHDFALKPQDMQKLAKADVLVINGAGLEEFLEKILSGPASGLPVIDGGANIALLPEAGHEGHDHGNPHIFAAPEDAAIMVGNIAAGLARLDPANAAVYEKNAAEYQGVLREISDRLKETGQKAANRRVALEHDALAYLARNAGLEVVNVFENSIAASRMASLLKELKASAPKVLAGDSQYPDRLLKTLSSETGIPFIQLNPCAGGPENAPLYYYQKVMEENLDILGNSFDK